MDLCKKPKRFLESESCSLGQNEDDSRNETDRVETKHQRKESLENSGDDFEEFVALMERIQHAKTEHRNLGIWEEIFMGDELLDVKVTETKPAEGMPLFQWEDFCVSKDTMAAQKDVCGDCSNDKQSSYEEKGKQSVQPAASFDLNVEALSNV